MKTNIKKNNIKNSFNWYILFIISLTSIMTGIYRDGFTSLFPLLQKDFHLTRALFGLHSTFFYFTSAFVSIYTGRMVDLKGPKWGQFYSSIIMGIFFILHSIAHSFSAILLMTAFTGVAVSFNLPTVNKFIVRWFPWEQRSIALGLQSIATPMGGLMGAIVLSFFGSIIGWRITMLIPGFLAILCALFLSYFYQEKGNENNYISEGSNSISFFKSICQLIKNRELVIVSIFGFFLGVMSSSVTTHFALFLFLDHGFTETLAGIGLAVVQLGSVLGRPAWGIFCDKVMDSDKRKTFLYMGVFFWLTTMILSSGLRYLNLSIRTLFLLAFITGSFGNGGSGILCASINETVKEENVGIAIGFGSIFMRSGLMIASPIFGFIADLKGSYSLSWFLLGITILFVSIGQFIFSKKC